MQLKTNGLDFIAKIKDLFKVMLELLLIIELSLLIPLVIPPQTSY